MGSITFPQIETCQTILRATNGGTVFSGNLKADTTMDYFTDTAVVDDCIYFEYGDNTSGVSKGLRFNVGTQLNAGAITVVWEYRSLDGNWTVFPNLVDGTNAFQNAGINDVTWDNPEWPWAVVVNGVSEAWTRVRITAIAAIVEGGAQQTDIVKGIYPCILIEGQNVGVPWDMDDVLAADVAGGWNVVKELQTGFPTDVEEHDWPKGSQVYDPWPDRERTWLINASFLFDDVTEEHQSIFKKEVLICHAIHSSLTSYSASRITFGEYDAASDTTRRGCIIICMGYGFYQGTAIGRRISTRKMNFYNTTLDVRGRNRSSFILDYHQYTHAVDCMFVNTVQNTMYDASCLFVRCSWISDWGSGPLVIASPTFTDCNFCASDGMAAAFYTYRSSYPVSIRGGSVRNYAGRFAFYMQRFGYFDTSAKFTVTNVSWSEVTTDIYWLVTMPTMPAYGYISNEKTLNLTVVTPAGAAIVGATVKIWDVDGVLVTDEVTDGLGQIPEQELVKDEWRKTAPEGASGTDTTRTPRTPHHIQIVADGYRTLDYHFEIVEEMEWILGLSITGGGPGGSVVAGREDATVSALGPGTVEAPGPGTVHAPTPGVVIGSGTKEVLA